MITPKYRPETNLELIKYVAEVEAHSAELIAALEGLLAAMTPAARDSHQRAVTEAYLAIASAKGQS